MSFSVFSPLHYDSMYKIPEKFGCLRFTTQFFDFGQKAYNIRHFNSSAIEVVEREKSNPSWINILIRVIAIFTVIIPLFMGLGIIIYRASNKFRINEYSQLDKLPNELLIDITNSLGQFSLMLGGTNKTFLQFVRSRDSLQKYQMAIQVLNQCNNIYYIYKPLSIFDPLRVLKWINRKEHESNLEKSQTLLLIANTFANFDMPKSLEVSKQSLEILETMPNYHTQTSLLITAALLYKSRGNEPKVLELLTQALEVVKSLTTSKKYEALAAIMNICVSGVYRELERLREYYPNSIYVCDFDIARPGALFS